MQKNDPWLLLAREVAIKPHQHAALDGVENDEQRQAIAGQHKGNISSCEFYYDPNRPKNNPHEMWDRSEEIRAKNRQASSKTRQQKRKGPRSRW